MPEISVVEQALQEHEATVTALRQLKDVIAALGTEMRERLSRGAKILWMGNGGSAADSQHMAAEIVGRFVKERKGLPSIALTTDSSILTAVGNDYGFDQVFSRQVEALCQPGDIVVGISTSGSSPNVVKAALVAREIGAYVVGFTGAHGGQLAEIADCAIRVPSKTTARIQECHILVGHILCEHIDATL